MVDDFLTAAGIGIVPVDRGLARAAAQLRAQHSSLRLPDAMCLATALQDDAALLTFDGQLANLDRSIR